MAKYMVLANYVGDGIKGLLKEGGSKRLEAVNKLVESVGGKVESFYYAFGETDAYVIADMPDNISAAAVALTAASSGLVTVTTIPLMTPEDLDAVSKKLPIYRAPGS